MLIHGNNPCDCCATKALTLRSSPRVDMPELHLASTSSSLIRICPLNILVPRNSSLRCATLFLLFTFPFWTYLLSLFHSFKFPPICRYLSHDFCVSTIIRSFRCQVSSLRSHGNRSASLVPFHQSVPQLERSLGAKAHGLQVIDQQKRRLSCHVAAVSSKSTAGIE